MKRASRAAAAGLSALTAVALRDLLQREHTLLRNFPVIGRARFLLESIGPELRQYLIASALTTNLAGGPMLEHGRTGEGQTPLR